MAGMASRLTQLFRRAARVLPTNSPLRQKVSAAWDRVLRLGGQHTDVPVGGRTVRLQVPFRRLDPSYEKESITLWGRLLAPGDVVWDVGSNYGLYTVLSGLAVGPTGRVVGWEPSPVASATATDHVAANGLSGWCVVRQAAVSDTPGVLPFSVSASDGNDPTNRLGTGKMGNTIDVPVETLDGAWQAGERPPQYLKIDVEGAEVFALRGGTKLFAPGGPRPTVLLAVHPMFLPEFGCDPNELADFVTRSGYTSFSTAGDPTAPTEYAEYLLVPDERREAVCRRLGWVG